MKQIKKMMAMGCVMLVMLAVDGCTTANQDMVVIEENVISTESDPLTADTEQVEKEVQIVAKKGSGEVVYEDVLEPLTMEQEELLTSYMTLYFEALADLTTMDAKDLFSDDIQAEASESGLDLQVSMRSMQSLDYSLTKYEYTLRCQEITEQEDGTIEIYAREDNIQNFAQMPEVNAERYDNYHYFVLEQIDGSWYIKSHMLFDSIYLALFQQTEDENLAESYVRMVPEYITAIEEKQQERETERTRQMTYKTASYPYDSTVAIEYANTYVNERNSQWPDYTGRGGNCQNLVSQALLAGGIPMDTQGGAVWKWYGSEVSNGAGGYGRSSSWTGVDAFVTYATNNTGYGLVADVDAPYFDGEPGDLIHMGREGHWGHSVIISEVVRDENGEVMDYLVHSNTSNLKNYPASLYGYPEMILTKIAGWNA